MIISPWSGNFTDGIAFTYDLLHSCRNGYGFKRWTTAAPVAPTTPPNGPCAASPSAAGGVIGRRSNAGGHGAVAVSTRYREVRIKRRRPTGPARPRSRESADRHGIGRRRQSRKRLEPQRRRPSENTCGAGRTDPTDSRNANRMMLERPNAGASL
jgi:hypothetical protein